MLPFLLDRFTLFMSIVASLSPRSDSLVLITLASCIERAFFSLTDTKNNEHGLVLVLGNGPEIPADANMQATSPGLGSAAIDLLPGQLGGTTSFISVDDSQRVFAIPHDPFHHLGQ